MRIISQDGAIDVPYELGTVTVDGNKVGFIFVSGDCWALAVYTNAEEAQRQVGKMHNMYMQMYMQGRKTSDKLQKISYENFPKVFRFPEDPKLVRI